MKNHKLRKHANLGVKIFSNTHCRKENEGIVHDLISKIPTRYRKTTVGLLNMAWIITVAISFAMLFALATATPAAAFSGEGSGTPDDPYKITNIDELQEMNDDLSASYILMNDIDASATSGWNGGAGFEPIGTDTVPFIGSFDGQGFKIENLYINRPSTDYVGLFGYVGSGGVVENVGLENEDATGRDTVGGLVGYNYGNISNSYTTGNMNATAIYNGVGGLVGWNQGSISNSHAIGSVSGIGSYDVGGLVGWNEGSIDNCYSASTVTGDGVDGVGGLVGWNESSISNSHAAGNVNGGWDVGGLVGYNYGGSISNSYATGNVDGSDDWVGGLVGHNDGTVSNSYATGNVSGGGKNIGGLVGRNDGGSISDSYATGSATGYTIVGGLVGWSSGTVDNSYATGIVSGEEKNIGGLVGRNYGDISNSYATGDVEGGEHSYNVGGLVGSNYDSATISNCYSMGSVSGNNTVGGLIGENDGTVSNSYSTGFVSGDDYVGGFVGYNYGDVSNSFWDIETSGTGTSDGGTGKTTAEMKTIGTFSEAGWDIVLIQNYVNETWYINDGNDYPKLGWQFSPGITINPTSGLTTTEAGGTAQFTVVLDTPPTAEVTINLSSSDTTEGTVFPTSLIFTSSNWDTPQTVTVTGVDDDIDDGDISYTIITAPAESLDPNYNGLDAEDVAVTNTDDDEPRRGGGGGGVIPPTAIALTAPNGGESWAGGSSQNITWIWSGTAISKVKLLYSLDRGATFPNVIATDEANDGTYSWTVPNVPSSTVKVKIEGYDSVGNLLVSDISDADFTITYTPPQISADNSTVTAAPTQVVANGTSYSTITVTVKDTAGALVSGKTVTLASSRGALDTITTVTGTTGADGVATFRVSSSTAGTSTYTATVNGTVITQTASVVFTSPEAPIEVPPGETLVTLNVGDLIKTSTSSTVYYYGSDNKRHIFPNALTYRTWYLDWSGIKVIPQSQLVGIPLGKNVTVRPGTVLVKIETDPKVYAVEPGGVLRWIPNEERARTLYGDAWAARIIDVPAVFWGDYTIGADITTDTHPTGALIQYSGTPEVYYIQGAEKRHIVNESAFVANNFRWINVLVVPTTFYYPTGAPITGKEPSLASIY